MSNEIRREEFEALANAVVFRITARPVFIRFVLANTSTEVRHGLKHVPDGYQVFSSIGAITRVENSQWTNDLAYLQSTKANDAVFIVFGTFKEEPLDVNP